MGVEKQVILLQVGAEVDQAGFNKAVSTADGAAKKIDKSLVSLMETSDNAGKKLIGTFNSKATKKAIEDYINNRAESAGSTIIDLLNNDKFNIFKVLSIFFLYLFKSLCLLINFLMYFIISLYWLSCKRF